MVRKQIQAVSCFTLVDFKRIMKMAIQSNIHLYCNSLAQGKTLLYPTDTIWGLGCDATNQEAVDAIFKLKNRPKNKPLIALVSDLDMLSKYVTKLPKNIESLLDTNIPTTLIYPKGKDLAKGVLSENGSVAIRIPKPCFALDLITAFGKPIVSTSANISGEPIPTLQHEIDVKILGQVDEIVPLKSENKTHIPSRILLLMPDGTVKKIR